MPTAEELQAIEALLELEALETLEARLEIF